MIARALAILFLCHVARSIEIIIAHNIREYLMAETRTHILGNVFADSLNGPGPGITGIILATGIAPQTPNSILVTNGTGIVTTVATLGTVDGGTGADLSGSTGGLSYAIKNVDGVMSNGPLVAPYGTTSGSVPTRDSYTGALHDGAAFVCDGLGNPGVADREYAQLRWNVGTSTYYLETAQAGTGVLRALYMNASSIRTTCGTGSTLAASAPEDFVRKAEFDSVIVSGIIWQAAVLAITVTPTLPPVNGDRYIASADSVTPLWTKNHIYQWDSVAAAWIDKVPAPGWGCLVLGGIAYSDQTVVYTDSIPNVWSPMGISINHDDLINRGTNTHTQLDSHLSTTTTDPHAGQDLRTSATPSHVGITLSGTLPAITFANTTAGPPTPGTTALTLAVDGSLQYSRPSTGTVGAMGLAMQTGYVSTSAYIETPLVAIPGGLAGVRIAPASNTDVATYPLEVFGATDSVIRMIRSASAYKASFDVLVATGELRTNAPHGAQITTRLGVGVASEDNVAIAALCTSGEQLRLYYDSTHYTTIRAQSDGSLDVTAIVSPATDVAVRFGARNPLVIQNTTASTLPTLGSMTIAGGIGIAGNACIGAEVRLFDITTPFTAYSRIWQNAAVTYIDCSAASRTLDVGTNFAQVKLNNTTDSTLPTLGSFITAGGAGVKKNMCIGAEMRVYDITTPFGAYTSMSHNGTSTLFASSVASRTMSIGASFDLFKVDSTISSTTISTGSFVAKGGAGIADNLCVGKEVRAFDITTPYSAYSRFWQNGTTSYLSCSAASRTLDVNANFSQIKLNGTTTSTTPTSGALITAGGAGIKENLCVGAEVRIFDITTPFTAYSRLWQNGTTTYIDCTAASRTLDISVNFSQVKLNGTTASTAPTLGALVVAGGIGSSGAMSSVNCSVWSPNLSTGHTDITVADTTGVTTFARSAGTLRNYIFDGDATTGTVSIQSTVVGSAGAGALSVLGGGYFAGTIFAGGLNMTNTVTMVDTDVLLAAASNSRLPTQLAVKSYVDSYWTLVDNPNGFPNITDSTISFNNTNWTFTIAPFAASFTYYISGTKYEKTTPTTVQLTPATTGSHYIYFDGATLKETMGFTDDLFLIYAIVAIVYWNNSVVANVYFGDERHGISMSPYTHRYLHYSVGTSYVSGLTPATFSGGTGGADADAEFIVSSGYIMDEDMKHLVAAKTLISTALQVVYLVGNPGVWTSVATPYLTPYGAYCSDGVQLYYNKLTGSTWSLATVISGRYVLGHLAATNGGTLIAFVGQNTYNNVSDARQAASDELSSMYLVGLPLAEWTFIATFIYRCSTGAANTMKGYVASISSGVYYEDWRAKKLNSAAGTPASHSSLSGLTADDHLQYFKVTGRPGEAITFQNADVTPKTSTIACTLSTGQMTFANYPGAGYTFSLNSSGGDVLVNSTTSSTLPTVGALIVAGGAGVKENLCIGAEMRLFDITTPFTAYSRIWQNGTSTYLDCSAASRTLDIGVNFAQVKLNGTTTSTTPITGSFITAGGAGIKENLCVGAEARMFDITTPFTAYSRIWQNGTSTYLDCSAASRTLDLSTNWAQVKLNNTTDSTTPITGSIITAGGAGIKKNLCVGAEMQLFDMVTPFTAHTRIYHQGDKTFLTCSTALQYLYIDVNFTQVWITSASSGTDPTHGALIVAGGIGVAENLCVGAEIRAFDITTPFTAYSRFWHNGTSSYLECSAASRTLVITTNWEQVKLNNTTDSTTPITGSIITAGGAGIKKNLCIGAEARIFDITTPFTAYSRLWQNGTTTYLDCTVSDRTLDINAHFATVKINATTSSTTTATGALVVTGGLGVDGYTHIGGQLNAHSYLKLYDITAPKTAYTSIHHNGTETLISCDAASRTLDINANFQMLLVNSNRASTGVASGAIVTYGGIGMAGNLCVGAEIRAYDKTTPFTANSVFYHNAGTTYLTNSDATQSLFISNKYTSIAIDGATESAAPQYGQLTLQGGIGVMKNITTRAELRLFDISTPFTAYSRIWHNGTSTHIDCDAAARTLDIGANFSQIKLNNTTSSTSPTTGALVVVGGIGAAKNISTGAEVRIFDMTTPFTAYTKIWHGGTYTHFDCDAPGRYLSFSVYFTQVKIDGTSASSSTTTGSLICAGGLGVAGDIYYGGNIFGPITTFSGNWHHEGSGSSPADVAATLKLNRIGNLVTLSCSASIIKTTPVTDGVMLYDTLVSAAMIPVSNVYRDVRCSVSATHVNYTMWIDTTGNIRVTSHTNTTIPNQVVTLFPFSIQWLI